MFSFLYRRLRCPRNVLHMHLFVSFILRAGMRFVKDEVFMETTHISVSVKCVFRYRYLLKGFSF